MIDLVSTVGGLVYDFVIVFSLLTACVHLRDISESIQELVSISYYLAEIKRRVDSIEKRLGKQKDIKAD